jgi:putative transposase
MKYPSEWPQFFTATINQWKPCLAEDVHKYIIIECLQTMVERKQIELNAFVIMSNHVHFIWQPLDEHTPAQIHSSFTTYTGKQIRNSMLILNPIMLEEMKSPNYDRGYQIWKRRSLSVELFTEGVFIQKLEYIHSNPVKAGIVKNAEDYLYSSAAFYCQGIDHFNILTHYSGN